MASEGGRQRGQSQSGIRSRGFDSLSFSNPYPWMGATEAMVHLALEAHHVPFSWRFFDGVAPTFTQMLVNTGYQPEFTLSEYHVVVVVTTSFWGTLPGVLDRVALAQVTLEADGWKVVNLFDSDIRTKGAWNLLIEAVPTLGTITGPVKVNPYGRPNLMQNVRRGHRQANPTVEKVSSHERRRARRGSSRSSDSGRRRIGQSGAVTSRSKSR